jgi:hypothetical protein
VTSPLEGAALFGAVSRLLGELTLSPDKFDIRWQLVPAMLGWLDTQDRGPTLERWRTCWLAISGEHECEGPDLPTALARLVLRVAEMEGKA